MFLRLLGCCRMRRTSEKSYTPTSVNKAQAQEQDRRDKARAELDAESERRLRIWQVNGGSKESFAKAWPDMERRILEEKLAALDRKRAEGSIF